jgi:hypothetical protein
MTDWVKAIIKIRELGTVAVQLLTALDRVEHEAGKKLEDMTDAELVELLSKVTKDSEDIFDAGVDSVSGPRGS